MNFWWISKFGIFLKKYFLYLFDINYKNLYAPQNKTFDTKFMFKFLFLFDFITHTWYFRYLFSFFFSLYLFSYSSVYFWFSKSNTHTMCGTWSHLTEGSYKRISGQKYEFFMYFKIRDFFEKIFFVHIWQKL